MTNITNKLQIEMMNIDNRTTRCIENFSFGPDFDPEFVGNKVEHMINTLDCMIAHTRNELINYFSEEETLLLVSLFTSTLIYPEVDPKGSLYLELIDSMELCESHEYFGVNQEEIIEKVQKLTSFQSFCLVNMCFQYLHLLKSQGGVDRDMNILKKLFLIKN